MKKNLKELTLVILVFALSQFSYAETIEYIYNFDSPVFTHEKSYTKISFKNTDLIGKTGHPIMPVRKVNLLLPQGEKVKNITFEYSDKIYIDQELLLYPTQPTLPISMMNKNRSELVKNTELYQKDIYYPEKQNNFCSTHYMSGFGVGFSSFTPLRYNPKTGKAFYYQKVIARVETEKSNKNIVKPKYIRKSVKKQLLDLIDNKNSPYLENYLKNNSSSKDSYSVLIITPELFVADFSDYINFYQGESNVKITSVETIDNSMEGEDMQEKIRNFIKKEYQDNSIEYVLLGGDVEHLPYRGFYCSVNSPHGSDEYMTEPSIPADLYYAALDGNWNDDGDNYWGEIGEDDLLQEVAVGRFPFSNSEELSNIIHKTITYQNYENNDDDYQNFLAGEWFNGDVSNPDDPFLSWGGDYLDLLIGSHNENGYTTTGIPDYINPVRLYDRDTGEWDASELLFEINEGFSELYHFGHSHYQYNMRLSNEDITNENFSAINGTDHNYILVNTGGCMPGGFHVDDCIGERMLVINNFAVAFIGNSSYGWNNEGSTDGPGTRLQRYYVDGKYGQNFKELGTCFKYSKMKTAPWVTALEQWEEGATRWNFYDQNILGDPVLSLRRPIVQITETDFQNKSFELAQNYPNPFNPSTTLSFNLKNDEKVSLSVFNYKGEMVQKLLNSEMKAGFHQIKWNGKNSFGKQVSSGVYFFKMNVAGYSKVIKGMLVK